jgi:hypothetical protein
MVALREYRILLSSLGMSQLTRDELDALLKRADDICRQAQEPQARLRAAMKDRPSGMQPAKRRATPEMDAGRKRTTRKSRQRTVPQRMFRRSFCLTV